MQFIYYLLVLLFKFVISGRDVTFVIRAKVLKKKLGSMRSELIVLHLHNYLLCLVLILIV